MANLNIVDAQRLLDEKLTDKEVDFLVAAREGLALADVEEDIFRDMYDLGLVDVINFDHPRARNAIKGVILSEDGTKIANEIDNRHWAEAETPISAEPESPVDPDNTDKVAKAQDTSKATNRKRNDIPADSPVNKDYENKR